MKNIIPFTKEIKFDNKISEITSISIEEKYNSTCDTIDGEFILSGEYRTHELSVNKEAFEYKLPFSVDLTDKINTDTLSFEISDFSYDILNDNVLKVNIEFIIEAELAVEDRKIIEEDVKEIIEQELKEETIKPEEIKSDPQKIIESVIETKEETPERIDVIDEETIIDSINANDSDNEYTTYHIHIIKNSETVESICALYNSNTSLISEYNDLNNFKVGEKLIVVEEND